MRLFEREKNYAAKYSQEFKFCSQQPPRNLKFQSLKFFSRAPPKFLSFNSRLNTQVPKEFSTLKNNSWPLQPGSPKFSPSRFKLSCWESPRSPQKIRWAVHGQYCYYDFFQQGNREAAKYYLADFFPLRGGGTPLSAKLFVAKWFSVKVVGGDTPLAEKIR